MSLEISTRDGVGRLTLAMPETGNKIAQTVVAQIAAELNKFAADKTLKAVLISAQGTDFSLGREQGGKRPDKPLALREAMMGPILAVYNAFRAIEVPVISLVQGQAHGFGCALAASADITVAADTAQFSFPELKSNMPPTLAMTAVFERVQLKAMTSMVLTCRPVSAQRAQAIGLVSEVVPAAELAQYGEDLLKTLTARERPALAAVKTFVNTVRLRSFEDAGDYGANLLTLVLSSQG